MANNQKSRICQKEKKIQEKLVNGSKKVQIFRKNHKIRVIKRKTRMILWNKIVTTVKIISMMNSNKHLKTVKLIKIKKKLNKKSNYKMRKINSNQQIKIKKFHKKYFKTMIY